MVHQVVGDDSVTLEGGRSLYKQILPELRAARKVELNFSELHIVTPTFFNASIGFLLRDFDVQKLKNLLNVSNLQPQDKEALSRVVENSKIIYGFEKPEVTSIDNHDDAE